MKTEAESVRQTEGAVRPHGKLRMEGAERRGLEERGRESRAVVSGI